MRKVQFYLGNRGWHYMVGDFTSQPFPSQQMAFEAYHIAFTDRRPHGK